nr:hypothetical protein [Rhodococcus opacus]
MVLAAAGLVGCGSGESSSTAAATTTTVVPTTTTTTTTTARPTTLPVTTPAAVVPAAPAQPAPVAPTSSAPVLVPMPAVVCMNLQTAQNTIQAAGVFFSRSADATGAGRMQVLDSNWVVVGQQPSPGELVGEGDAVLSVVKIGEPNPC